MMHLKQCTHTCVAHLLALTQPSDDKTTRTRRCHQTCVHLLLCVRYHVHLILWAVGTLCASYTAYHIQHDIHKWFVFGSWYCIAGHVYFWFHMVSLRSDLYKATATQNTFLVSTSRSLHSRFRGNWPCLLWKGQSRDPPRDIPHRQNNFQAGDIVLPNANSLPQAYLTYWQKGCI